MAARCVILILGFTKITKGKQEGFIVGGKTASNIKEFAYCASLFIDDTVRCGSSVLNQWFLLTAAHCLEHVSQIEVNVGSLDRDQGAKGDVAKYRRHSNYLEETMQNDIGLCRLKKALELSQTVNRVMLLRRTPAAEEGEVAGWGLVNEHTRVDSDHLKHTKQKLWSFPKCKKVMKDALPVGTICGGEISIKRDFASEGDSGGPFVVRDHIQVGLVSFKIPAISDSLVVYTNVSHFYDWIMNTARRLACKWSDL